MSAEIISMADIKPKTLNKTYKHTRYKITYVVADKEWEWDIEYVQTTHFKGRAADQNRAMRAAEKHIDKTKEITG